MGTIRPPSVLDAWDELTRAVAPPKVQRRATFRLNLPMGALVGATVVIAVLALLVPRLVDTPGAGGGPPPTATGIVRPSPSETPDARPVRLRLVAIQDVILSDDRLSARVDFLADTCADGYEGSARDVLGVLEVGIYELGDPSEPRPTSDASGIPLVCAGVGVQRSLELSLDAPFAGAEVQDLYGQVLWLDAPPWLAVVTDLPGGWKLRREGNVLGTPTARWERTWSPVRDPDRLGRDPTLTLIQSFNGPVGTTGGNEMSSVEVNGRPATLSLDRYPFATEMLLVWSIGEDEFALVGYDRDFSRDEIIAIAESITLPSGQQP